MTELGRREFIKSMVVGGAVLSLEGALVAPHLDAASRDLKSIGECRRVAIKCISEVGWWDTKLLLEELKKGGGPQECDQWNAEWTNKNGAGFCSLVEVEALNGTKTKFLIDTGWNAEYIDERLKAEGVDAMLKNGEIAFLYITHEHLDHLWGLEAALKYNPEIKILIPGSFHAPGIQFIEGAEFAKLGVKNAIKHRGQVVKLQVGEMTKLADGMVSVSFDIPIILKIRGEQSLYFNVKDVGLVLCAGCCHQNVVALADYAVQNLGAQGKLYGIYGGLHIAPFGPLGDKEKGWIEKMGTYGFKKIAANHCTGLPAVQKMIELGYPVVKGLGKKGSISDLYVGNGDWVVFG